MDKYVPAQVVRRNAPSEPERTQDAVGRLDRWETAGGTWRLLSLTPVSATVALCRCDGGEEVERLVSADPELLAYLGTRTSSED
jgi:hypothetical protein